MWDWRISDLMGQKEKAIEDVRNSHFWLCTISV
jgi:hypothetical protein